MIDLRMKIESRTRPRTITSIKIITHPKLLAHETSLYIFWVIPDTIDANIRSDIPLETPFSVINSPIHIIKTDHTVIANAVAKIVGNEVSMTLPPSR